MDKKTILLVEDDQLDVISVQRSLNKLGTPFQLFTAFNGVEALDILRGSGQEAPLSPLPDIILLDINMPKMNGIEFLTLLRQDERYKAIKVFVMTTSGEQHDRNEMERLGISGYLIKPLNFNNNNKRTDSMEGFLQFHIGKILRNDF
jgi:CheY-like chemotaxis protein